MEVFWLVLLFSCFFLSFGESDVFGAHSTEPNERKTYEPELFPPKPTFAGQTRKPRTLFKKLHSKAAFLTGLKLGAILSKKGFELGHGKIASTHSFQIFGKSVNSAMSLSYGDTGSSLPFVDDDPGPVSPKRTTENETEDDKKIYHVTVVEDIYNDTKEDLSRRDEGEKSNKDRANDAEKDDYVVLIQDAVEEKPEKERESDFLKEHNKRVKEFNESIFKRIKKL